VIAVIDNYDSFTYNLVQYLGELGEELEIYRNDAVTPEQLAQRNPQRIVLSPGPCSPTEAGNCNDIIRGFAGKVPLLGVCLGHQCVGYVFGGKIVSARRLMHGKTSTIIHDGKGLFAGLPNPFTAVRYHSLAVEREGLPPELEITAEAEDGEVMGLRHRRYAIEGVQFHPESILTEVGMDILRNFLRMGVGGDD
jgi:anthranilate synthase/aminodeoxychorismate synthase-like glutamine amidotransferase